MERRCRARRLSPRGRARLHAGAGTLARRDAGLTLIELVVAVSVFALLAGSVAAVAGSGLGLARNNRDRSVGANLASEDIDAVNQMKFSDLLAQEGTVVTKSPVVGAVTYTVKRAVSWTTTDSGTSICAYQAGGSRASWVLGVTTTVTWPAMTTPESAAKATTTVSPPVGTAPGANAGTVPVTVRDSSGLPVPGITVAATDGGANNYTTTTDSKGCAFLLVQPATYTLTLGTANYVDRQGNASPSTVFSISGGGNVGVSFDYDHPGSLTVAADAPSSAPAPSGLPVSVAYQFFQPAGVKTFPSTGAPPVTIGGLFPDSYTAWFGDCTDADPQSWPSGARAAPVAVGPGGTGALTAPLGAVQVTVTLAGVPNAGATVTATHDSATCPTGSPSVAGYPLGTTAADGTLLAALPWGNWVLDVKPAGGVDTLKPAVLDPNVAGPVAVVVAQ